MGLILHIRLPKTELLGITKDRVKREYAHIEEQLEWWAELPRHSQLELSGSMLQAFWARKEFGEGDVLAHTPYKLLRDTIARVLEETATTCRDHALPPDAYIDEASWLLKGLIDSVYAEMVRIEAGARRVRQEREAQAIRFTAPSQRREEARPLHEIARGLKEGCRQFEIEYGVRALAEFLAEQVKAFKLLALRQEDKARSLKSVTDDSLARAPETEGRQPKELKDRFTFRPGQALFDGKDLGLPSDAPVTVLKELVGNFGQVIPYTKFDKHYSSATPGTLPKTVTIIRRALAKQKVPCQIKAKTGVGYLICETEQARKRKKQVRRRS